MTDRVRIFDREGAALADIQASVSRAWLLNDEGAAQFTVSAKEQPAHRTGMTDHKTLRYIDELYRFGNYVLIENSEGLPDWVGVIDTPRIWGDGMVEINAYSIERVLRWRLGANIARLTGSAGAIFATLINIANMQAATIIRVGDVWQGGTPREETVQVVPIIEEIRRLQSRTGNDYEFIPRVIGGKLEALANWRQSAGTVTALRLEEGHNIADRSPILREQGQINNDVTALGQGVTWDSRLKYRRVDTDSIARYGVRQATVETGGAQPATVDRAGAAALWYYKQPRWTVQASALNVGDTYSFLRPGNVVSIRMWSAGNGETISAKILGMSFDPANGRVDLVLDEVIPNEAE